MFQRNNLYPSRSIPFWGLGSTVPVPVPFRVLGIPVFHQHPPVIYSILIIPSEYNIKMFRNIAES